MLDALAWLSVIVLVVLAAVMAAAGWLVSCLEPFDVVPDEED